MIYYLIPARKSSQAFPGKNRILFKYTADLVREQGKAVLVSTDDDIILDMAKQYGFTSIKRPSALAENTSDMLGVLHHVIEAKSLCGGDIIVLLYLTSPDRSWGDVDRAFSIFRDSSASSLVCRTPAQTSPYMCIHEDGKPVLEHGFYRRQDFPRCFLVRHHVAIYRVSEIPHLNFLLFNDGTVWMDIPKPVDIDTEEDFKAFLESKTDNNR